MSQLKKPFALVVSRFNEEINAGLRQGALEYLKEKGYETQDADIYEAPGAFEIPLIAQKVAKTGKYSGIICLGCVIKGDTAHFEFISLGTTLGLIQSMLATEVPITFGVLTTYTEEQALIRSRPSSGAKRKDLETNKGREAAAACIETAELLATLDS